MTNHGIPICNTRGAKYVARLPGAFQRHPDVVSLRQRNLCGTGRACLHHACETQCQQRLVWMAPEITKRQALAFCLTPMTTMRTARSAAILMWTRVSDSAA